MWSFAIANQSYYFRFFRISDDYTKAKQDTGADNYKDRALGTRQCTRGPT